MTISYPSPEFDDAVAAVCHGSASEVEMRALNELLRREAGARDEYLMRVELHARLASAPDLFALSKLGDGSSKIGFRNSELPSPDSQLPTPMSDLPTPKWKPAPILALAACLAVMAAGIWAFWFRQPPVRNGATSTAVAMLTRAVDARWDRNAELPRVGGALEPGRLRLKSGLAQVVFYSGARIVIEGPAELQLISPMEAVCHGGRLLAEVPPPARGFRLRTAQLDVVDLGTAFGVDATHGRTEVDVFKGRVELLDGAAAHQALTEGHAVVVQDKAPARLMAASAAAFSPLFELQERSLASEAIRYDQWRFSSARLDLDPSLVLHLDLENLGASDWTLRNSAAQSRSAPDATIVGCQCAEGRWPEKQALEFQSANDRVRLAVPGEFDSLTLSAWVRIKGLDRQFNSLLMSDGFEPGAIHWLIRNDGVLSLTVMGAGPRQLQIVTSPPIITLDKFGMWIHLAVVLDGRNQEVVHYVNGKPVARQALKLGPPFRVGSAELGNWNARGNSKPNPLLIRNFSGSLDEFELFGRALGDAEVRDLYTEGKPQTDP